MDFNIIAIQMNYVFIYDLSVEFKTCISNTLLDIQ